MPDNAAAEALNHRFLAVDGEESLDFLQAICACDLKRLAKDPFMLGSLCQPQGRVLAVFYLFSTAAGYALMVPSSLAEGLAHRLRLYVLRRRLEVRLLDDWSALALIGPAADEAGLEGIGGIHSVDVSRTIPRRLFFGPADSMAAARSRLQLDIEERGQTRWRLAAIAEGEPWLESRTQDLFLPQMLNLLELGAASVAKGCYPGQEVVARLHFRGQSNRCLQRLAFSGASTAPAPSSTLVQREEGDRSGKREPGMILDAVLTEAGGYALAVLDKDALGRIGELTGTEAPELCFEPLKDDAAAVLQENRHA